MRTYFTLINHCKTVLEEDELVNTITYATVQNIDLFKKNIFPIANVLVHESPFVNSTAFTRYNVEITALDIRDLNKEEDRDKFYYNDNRQDNWNLTRAILNTFQSKIAKDHLGTDIELIDATAALKIDNEFSNNLDGWTQTFTIDVPNDYTTIC